MGCCFCCLSEADKVGRVLQKFPAQPVKSAAPGLLQKLVGRVVLAGTAPFYSPAKNSPCVYYKTKVDQEFVDHYRDEETGQQRERRYWKQIASSTRFTDFYLQDGTFKLFVKGSDRGRCKVQSGSETEQASNAWLSWSGPPPPGIQQMINQSNAGWRWNATQKFRYTEERFDVNEIVAALGVVTQAVDPYTQQSIAILNPIATDALDEKYFEEHEWGDWDKRSWIDLVQKNPSVLLSDNRKFTNGVQIDPIQNLPVWMTSYDAKFVGGQQGVPQMQMQMAPAPQQQMMVNPNMVQMQMNGQPQQPMMMNPNMQQQPMQMQGQPNMQMQGQPVMQMQGQPVMQMQGQPNMQMQGQPNMQMQGQFQQQYQQPQQQMR